ncbi:hypothetical protein M1B72_20090 [Geomonas paludis]|uniref:Uncharacterized protein n=1 Tax=Geomonas paludis TaxID=2740185 RepID=A0A6V8MSI0_9BACT|nr:hypothetical protein [Geomonas paludis]UPU35714.1 hypothetical protein M1B72_20090 [Geomonas paludis]GFO62707.1 hypothetical protein GMPD_06260 [Geomonas paludis]
MKQLLSFAAVGLLTSALLDPLIQSGLDKPVPWPRDIGMFVAGAVCLYLLVKYRREL